jgi:signal peptidase I
VVLIVLLLGVTGAVALAATWAARWLVVVTVTGSSMLPGLSDGDTVVVRRTRVASARVGDLVCWTAPAPASGHRRELSGHSTATGRSSAWPPSPVTRLPRRSAGLPGRGSPAGGSSSWGTTGR